MTVHNDNHRNRFAATWFRSWLWLFAAAFAAALAVAALGMVPQMQALGAFTVVLSLVGALVCLLGLRTYDARSWNSVRGHVTSVRESARSAAQALADRNAGARSAAADPVPL